MTRKKKSKSTVELPSAAEQVHNRLRSIFGEDGNQSTPAPKTKKKQIPTPEVDVDVDGVDVPDTIGPAIPTSIRSLQDIKDETLKASKG